MIELDKIYNEDCLEGLKAMPDGCIDLCVTDPPYEFKDTTGAGAFGTCRGKSAKKEGRTYHAEVTPMSNGISDEVLEQICRVCKIPNIYLFCNKDQVPQYLNFGISHKLNYDILAWHKPDPTPMCGNKYLSDTEYIIFLRGKGAKVYGTYASKRKFWVQNTNVEDKAMWQHPTIKPLNIVRTLVFNSSQEGGVILDPFIGSGTTAVACMKEKRHFIGFELNEDYYKIACKRIKNESQQLSLF
jgi:DNA modification methylase